MKDKYRKQCSKCWMEKSNVSAAQTVIYVKKDKLVFLKSFNFKLMSKSYSKETNLTKVITSLRNNLIASRPSVFCHSITAT